MTGTGRNDPATRRIALVRSGDMPRLNQRLTGMLATTFPGQPVDDIDVFKLARGRIDRFLACAATGAVENAARLASRRIRPKRAFVTSSVYARIAGAHIARRASPVTHEFTFQSQSLFPVYVPGVPNFVFTDNTNLANLGFPGFDRRAMPSRSVLRREVETYRSAAMVFARSTHVRDSVVHGYGCPPERVAVVGCGPNIDVIPRPPDGWFGGRIVFVGVDWVRKGGPQLVAAFQRLRESAPTRRLEIVGCEPEGIGGPGITVHGRLGPDAVATLLAESDVFCLPTRAEPFGVAFIEAMLTGLPVVGTTIGAVPDLVHDGDSGRLVPPDDVAALHDALADIVAHPDKAREMGASARACGLARYRWDVVMATIAGHIADTLAGSSGRLI